MTTILEMYANMNRDVICPECGGKCVEKMSIGDEYTLYQCAQCKEIYVIESMTNDIKIKCKLCKLLHKRDCNSCTEHFARVENMSIYEKIVWWFK